MILAVVQVLILFLAAVIVGFSIRTHRMWHGIIEWVVMIAAAFIIVSWLR